MIPYLSLCVPVDKVTFLKGEEVIESREILNIIQLITNETLSSFSLCPAIIDIQINNTILMIYLVMQFGTETGSVSFTVPIFKEEAPLSSTSVVLLAAMFKWVWSNHYLITGVSMLSRRVSHIAPHLKHVCWGED